MAASLKNKPVAAQMADRRFIFLNEYPQKPFDGG
jgi:hypothetical protein